MVWHAGCVWGLHGGWARPLPQSPRPTCAVMRPPCVLWALAEPETTGPDVEPQNPAPALQCPCLPDTVRLPV